ERDARRRHRLNAGKCRTGELYAVGIAFEYCFPGPRRITPVVVAQVNSKNGLFLVDDGGERDVPVPRETVQQFVQRRSISGELRIVRVVKIRENEVAEEAPARVIAC